MIYCIECQFKGWSHQEVNSGLIKEIAEVSGRQKVCVVAEQSHIDVLKTYEYGKEIEFKDYQMKSIEASKSGEDDCNFKDYIVSLKQLFEDIQLKEGDKVFFMSSNRALIVALELLAVKYRTVKFFLAIHAILEKAIKDGMMEESKRFFTLKNALRLLALNRNVYLISYAPNTKKLLSKFLPSKALKQLIYLHHPVEKNQPEQEFKRDDSKIQIALIGAAVNAMGVKVINTVLSKTDKKNVEFVVLDRQYVQNTFLDERVRVTRKVMGFEEDEIREAILKADWILLPYDSSKYQISASGIFADAIRYEKPILALNSPYIKYYNDKCRIGFVEETVEELSDRIVGIVDGADTKEFYHNVKNIAGKMKRYNEKRLTQLLN